MGTRCVTVIKCESGETICELYRQFDGCVEGHGVELAEFLQGKRVINGIGGDDNASNSFNGMACLAAAVVSHFKNDIGKFYLHPPGSFEQDEFYRYTITGQAANVPMIEIHDYGDKVFYGTPDELIEFAKSQ